jgi:hypothetical protein
MNLAGSRLRSMDVPGRGVIDVVGRPAAAGDGQANSGDGNRDDRDACKRRPRDGDDANAAQPVPGSLVPTQAKPARLVRLQGTF